MGSAEIFTSIRQPDDDFEIGRFADSISKESDAFDEIFASSSSPSSPSDFEVSSTTLASVPTTALGQIFNASMFSENVNGSQKIDLQVGNIFL
jgi:hypothetical protein